MKKVQSLPQNTVVFNKNNFNFYFILAVFATLLAKVKNFFPFTVTSASNPDITNEYPRATKLVEAKRPTTINEVSDLNTLMAYCIQWIQIPSVSLLVRLFTGKSRIDLRATYDLFVAQGYSGISLVMAFWNFVSFTINQHLAALKSQVVLDYVKNAKATEITNGVTMITVNGNVEVNDYEKLAIETLLLDKYNNTSCIITFEVPEVTGLTSFFNDEEKSTRFSNEILAHYTDVENSYENPQTWRKNGDTIFIGGTSAIPAEQRAEVLNDGIKLALVRVFNSERANA